jgi:hypothetical protein
MEGVEMKRILVVLSLALLVAVFSFASQNTATQEIRIVVSPVALISVSKPVLEFDISQQNLLPGEAPKLANIDGGTIKYTSVTPDQMPRSITVSVAEQAVPTGFEVGVVVLPPDNAVGVLGASTGRVVLDSIPRTVISQIGTGWTGSDYEDGARVLYDLGILSHEALEIGSFEIEVLFTITED